MIWSSFSDFFAMGGYGLYVWGSVGVTAILMILEIIQIKQATQHLIDYSEITESK